MTVLKTRGKIVGASLTKAEETAMNMEIRKAVREFDQENMNKIDALVLWVLHDKFGFGRERLLRFMNAFNPALDELIRHYEMEHEDEEWLCLEKLKEIGVDVEAINREQKQTH